MSDNKIKFHRFLCFFKWGRSQLPHVTEYTIPADAYSSYYGPIYVDRFKDVADGYPGPLDAENVAIITVPKSSLVPEDEEEYSDAETHTRLFYTYFASTEAYNHITKFTCHAYAEDFENREKHGIDPYEAAAKRVIRSHIEGRSWPAKNEDVV